MAVLAADGGSRGDGKRSAATTATTSDAIRAEFAKLIDAYNERLTSKDVAGIVNLYSSDPMFIPKYAPPAVGREAVRKAYEWVFATLKLNGRIGTYSQLLLLRRATDLG